MTLSITSKKQARALYKVSEVPNLPEFGWLTQSQLRHLIFQSQPRFASDGKVIPANGMMEMGVIKRVGKRILIDVDKLRAWVNGDPVPQDLTMDIN